MKKIFAFVVSLALVGICGAGTADTRKGGLTQPAKIEVSGNLNVTDVTPEKQDAAIVPCDPPSNLRTSDLCAQWKAADSAERAANWSKWQFWSALTLGVATLFGVGITVYQTQRTVRITQETLHADRAWMTSLLPWGEHQGHVWAGDRGELIFPINVQWNNSGRSPATQVSAVVRHELVLKGASAPVFASDFDRQGMLIGQGTWFKPPSITLTRGELISCLASERDLYIFSHCKYRDVYDPSTPRHTMVCFKMNFEMIEIDLLVTKIVTSVEAVEGQHSYS